MSTISAPLGVGDLLRDWRQRRRLSQLDLSNEAAVSARHLSFVETGRSKPSRELVLHLAEHLDVPLRERNSLLMAAGYAPVYRERSLDDAEMDPVRGALDMILAGHEPYPAVIVDRLWNLVTANAAALSLFATGVAPHLLEPPVNVVRLGVHPDGLAPRTRNLAEFSEHLLVRLQRQLAVSPDAELQALYDEVLTYPGVTSHSPVVADPDHPAVRADAVRGGRRPGALDVQHAGHLRHRAGHHARRAEHRELLPGRRRHRGLLQGVISYCASSSSRRS